jgi:hypothetical protein
MQTGQSIVPGRVYIIRNARLDAEWASVDRRFMGIAGRAISTMISASGYNDVLRMYALAQRDNLEFHLAAIGPDFTEKLYEPFEQAFMRALFDYGYRKARSGYEWRNRPPIV